MSTGSRFHTASVRRFLESSDGAFSILTAILSVVMISALGLAVDLGSVVYWQSRLQAATDAAALAATFDLSRSGEIALSSLQANGPATAVIETSEVGTYIDDPAIAGGNRFTAGAADNAVHLATSYDVPVYFIRVLTGISMISIDADAVAYNLPLAGVAIGTSAAETDAGQVNDFITAVSGNSFNLTDEEIAALDQTSISVFRVLDRLAEAGGSQTTPITSVLASDVDLTTLASAAASALSAQAQMPTATQTMAINALSRIAQNAGSTSFVPAESFVTLGAHQQRNAVDMISAANDTLGIPALSLLMGYLHASRESTLIAQSLSIPLAGLATVSVDAVVSRSAIGEAAVGTSTIGPEGSSAASSQARVRLNIQLLQPINLGVISLPLSIPVVVELGYGGATITDIACGTDVRATTDITVAAQSGAARIFVGNVTDGELADLLTPLNPDPAQIVTGVPLLSISGETEVSVAQSSATLHFDWNDIQAGTVKTIDSSPTVQDALTLTDNTLSLVVDNDLPFPVNALVNTAVNTVVRPLVSTLLTALQPELETILASLGLKLGTLDVRATAVRCGIPALVT
jgi:tight adherence protein G